MKDYTVEDLQEETGATAAQVVEVLPALSTLATNPSEKDSEMLLWDADGFEAAKSILAGSISSGKATKVVKVGDKRSKKVDDGEEVTLEQLKEEEAAMVKGKVKKDAAPTKGGRRKRLTVDEVAAKAKTNINVVNQARKVGAISAGNYEKDGRAYLYYLDAVEEVAAFMAARPGRGGGGGKKAGSAKKAPTKKMLPPTVPAKRALPPKKLTETAVVTPVVDLSPQEVSAREMQITTHRGASSSHSAEFIRAGACESAKASIANLEARIAELKQLIADLGYDDKVALAS